MKKKMLLPLAAVLALSDLSNLYSQDLNTLQNKNDTTTKLVSPKIDINYFNSQLKHLTFNDITFDSVVITRPDFKDVSHPGDNVVTKYFGVFEYSKLDTLPAGLLGKLGVKNIAPGAKTGADLVKSYFNRTRSSFATRTYDSVQISQQELRKFLKNHCDSLSYPFKATPLESKYHVETLPDGRVVQGEDVIGLIEIDEKPRKATLEDVLKKRNKVLDFTGGSVPEKTSDSAKTKSIAPYRFGFSVGGFTDLKDAYGVDFRLIIPFGKHLYAFTGFRMGDEYTIKSVSQIDNVSPPVDDFVYRSTFSEKKESTASTNNFLPVGIGYRTNNNWMFGIEGILGRTSKTNTSQELQKTVLIPTGEVLDENVPVGPAKVVHNNSYSLNKLGPVVGKTFKKGWGAYVSAHYDLKNKGFDVGIGASYNLPRSKVSKRRK